MIGLASGTTGLTKTSSTVVAATDVATTIRNLVVQTFMFTRGTVIVLLFLLFSPLAWLLSFLTILLRASTRNAKGSLLRFLFALLPRERL